MRSHIPPKIFILLLFVLLIFISQASAQAPDPLPTPDHNTAILVVDDFGLPAMGASPATTAIDCLLLHTIDPAGEEAQGQATRAMGMATRSLGMSTDENDISSFPHGKYVFTQLADFSDPSAYDDLPLEDYIIDPYLDGSNNFVRYTYPLTHTILPGQIATNPNEFEFTGYDLIPVHVPDGDSLDEVLTDAVSRTVAIGYSNVVVNMSFGFFDCDDVDNYIADPLNTVDNVETSDFHTAITNLSTTYPEVVFVGSSGNFSKNSPFAPAVWDEVISVGAYDTIDTIYNISAIELFHARRDVPGDNYANIGSVLMPGAWGDNSQDNSVYEGDGIHRVHLEGTSFAAPYFSMFVAQYLANSGLECNSSGFSPDTLTEALFIDWSGAVSEDSRNLETIIRKNTCPELNAESYNAATKNLNFSIYSGTPSLSLSLTTPLDGATVPSTFELAGGSIDMNAGIANGSGISEVQVHGGSDCLTGSPLTLFLAQDFDQDGFDVTYQDSGFSTNIENQADGSLTLTICAFSELSQSAPEVSETITLTVDDSIATAVYRITPSQLRQPRTLNCAK